MSPIRNNLIKLEDNLNRINSSLSIKMKFKFDKYYYISYMKKEENIFNIYETVSTDHPFLWLKRKKEEGMVISILTYQGISEQDSAMYAALEL